MKIFPELSQRRTRLYLRDLRDLDVGIRSPALCRLLLKRVPRAPPSRWKRMFRSSSEKMTAKPWEQAETGEDREADEIEYEPGPTRRTHRAAAPIGPTLH